MHRACSNIEKEPYFFHGHPSNFLVTQIEKSQILTQIDCFRTVTWVWIHRYLWNNAQSLKWDRRDALLLFKVIRQISRSQGLKNQKGTPSILCRALKTANMSLRTCVVVKQMQSNPIYIELCASFHSHQWIQAEVTVQKPSIWVKIGDFCPVWPWNLMNDLEKQ